MERVQLLKQVFGRATYTRVIDTDFSELIQPTTGSSASTQLTVEEFFDYYDQLFFNIPPTGEVNSHEYLVKRSTDYLGGGIQSDIELAYLDEINSLREQLLEANANLANLNNVI